MAGGGSLRVVRRPKGTPARRSASLTAAASTAITAASQPIDNPQKHFSTIGSTFGRQDWQFEAWEMVSIVGELAYWLAWRSNSVSSVRLVGSEIDDDGMPTGSISEDAGSEGQRVIEIVKSIAGGPLGQSQMLKRAAECLSVPGEMWVAIITRTARDPFTGQDKARECWHVFAREEIRFKSGDGAELELPDGTKHDFNVAVDTLFRVWFPSPRRAKEPTSPVRSVLDPLREIVRTTKKIKNASKSRLIGNGIVFLPQEMSLPKAQGPIAADQPGAPIGEITGVGAADQLNTLLYDVAQVAIEDEDSQAALIPILATVPGEHLDKVQHLKFGNDVTEVEIKTRNDAIARLAMGLDVSPERLLGLGSNANHWSARQIGDEDVQLHIKPVMETLCAAFNEQVFKLVLAREGIDPDKYMLWYDASRLTADPDLTDEAKTAHEAGALTSAFLRKYSGLAEDAGYDLTTIEGAEEWARDAVTKDPTLLANPAIQMLLGGELASIEWPKPVVVALPPGNSDNEDDPEQDVETDPGAEPDTEANPDIQNNEYRSAVESIFVDRALELAGKRRVNTRDRDQQARLRDVPAHEYHRYLPPVRQAEIPKLIAGWDSTLVDETIALLGVDTQALRASVVRIVRDKLTRALIEVS